MPLVTDYRQVKDTYQKAVEIGVGLPVFCAEDRETLERVMPHLKHAVSPIYS